MVTTYSITAERPVIIIGAGPVGLAAAARCAANGIPFRLLEAGARAAEAVREWGHVRLFSPWSECIDRQAVELLLASGWLAPDGAAYPHGRELVRQYLDPLSRVPTIDANAHYASRVTAIRPMSGRGRGGPPVFRVQTAAGTEFAAGAVIDVTGTWGSPQTLPRTGCRRSARVHYRVPDIRSAGMRHQLAQKRVAIVGAGHSGMTLLLQLVEWWPVAEILWIRRGPVVHSGAPLGPGSARLALEREAEAAASHPKVRVLSGVAVDQFRETSTSVHALGRDADGARIVIVADHVFASIGFQADHRIADGLRLALDHSLGAPAGLAPLIDPRLHSCNTVPRHGWQELRHPQPGYFVVGSKSYGRAPNFALTTGYAQVDSLIAHLMPGAICASGHAPDCRPCRAECA